MIEPYFGDIRNIILNNLQQARYDIYVAVAWFTDKQLFEVLLQKANQGLNIELVLTKDEINLRNSFDYINLVENGGKVFWDDHHHKFCVIDREIVITGSYNWTDKVSNRSLRENILVIKNEKHLITKFSDEFKTLIKSADKFKLEPKIEVIEKFEIIENTVFLSRKNNLLLKNHKERLIWWQQCNKDWKRVFSIILNKPYLLETPSKNDIIELLQITTLDLSNFQLETIEPLFQMANLQTIKFSNLSNTNRQRLKKELEGINIICITPS